MTYERDLKAVYKHMLWDRPKASDEDELDDYLQEPEEDDAEKYKEEVIKIDPSPSSLGNLHDKIGLILIRAHKPLEGNPVVVFCHGNGERARDYIGYSEDFCPHGLSICCIDYRGYGVADGTVGTGASEPDDAITAINYLKKNGFQKVSYFGYSLGARCGLFVASHLTDLVCVCLDSPWLSDREWAEYKALKFEGVGHERFEKVLPAVYKKVLEKTGIDLEKVKDAREIVQKICQPLYLVHGKKDHLVPYGNSEELINLVKSEVKTFKTLNCGHEYCYQRLNIWNDMFKFILKSNGVEV